LTTTIRTITRADFVPGSFSEMYSHYYDYCVRLVAKQGIEEQSAEDVAQTILVKFFEHNALADYDPEHTTVVNGQQRRAAFRTFLASFVIAYLRHYVNRQAIHKNREGTSTDQPLGTEEGLTVLDALAPAYEERYDDLYEQELIAAVKHRITEEPKKRASTCDMGAFFEAVVRQFHNTGVIDALALAAEFNISKSSVNNWLKSLRSTITAVVA
jgi:DNA-directed RNA polymerase specialized sigma24 family protein